MKQELETMLGDKFTDTIEKKCNLNCYMGQKNYKSKIDFSQINNGRK